MNEKISIKDLKILDQLDINSRQSDTEISKKVRLSKQLVNYRIKKLVEKNIITSFFPQINIMKLGYYGYKFYLQLKSLPKEKEDELWNYLKDQNEILWIVSCSGRWDLIFAVIFIDLDQVNTFLIKFMNKYGELIVDKTITIFNKATLHHRKWLLNKKNDNVFWTIGGETKEEKADAIDKTILKILAKNARIPIVDIANKVKISSTSVIKRVRKMQKKGIICGFRISLNKEKLGINYCKAFIYYNSRKIEEENKLLEYCRNLPNILGVSQNIGSWDLELEFEVKQYNEFHKIMKEIKKNFPIIRNFETAYIEQEEGFSFLPRDI